VTVACISAHCRSRSNIALERTAGSHALAAAAQRGVVRTVWRVKSDGPE
jgi:hypothetical protein